MDDQTSGPRLYFIHVMKTGGSSLSRTLRGLHPREAFYPGLNDDGTTSQSQKIFAHHLLDLAPEARRAIRCYSVHLPAWVSASVATDHLTFTVLREPVERTISHLRHIARIDGTPSDIEEIYDDPEWRMILANYQTRVFGETRDEYEESVRNATAWVQTVDRVTAEDAFRRGVKLNWATGFPYPLPIGRTHLVQAIATLESLGEVGTLDRLDQLVERLERHTGRSLGPVKHLNAAPESDHHGFVELRARIRADTVLDAELYARARDLAASKG